MENKFNIEDIFNLVEMKKKAIAIYFDVNSSDYMQYPNGITLTKIKNIKLEVILNNIKNHISTSGNIIGKGYNNNPPMSDDEIDLSFISMNIYEIELR